MSLVLAQDLPQMGLVSDEAAVQDLAAASAAAQRHAAVPAHDRVRGNQQPQPVTTGSRITLTRVASRARSARVSFGRHP